MCDNHSLLPVVKSMKFSGKYVPSFSGSTKGYEAFLKDFTEIKEISAKDYKVMTDCDAYMKEHEIEKSDGYKYIVVMIGENQ